MGFRVSAAVAVLLASTTCAAQAAPLAGDPVHGKQVFASRCGLCHSAGPGVGEAGQGPPLAGVVGHPAASAKDFDYTAALKSAHLVWTPDTLDTWLAGPGKMVRTADRHADRGGRRQDPRGPHRLPRQREGALIESHPGPDTFEDGRRLETRTYLKTGDSGRLGPGPRLTETTTRRAGDAISGPPRAGGPDGRRNPRLRRPAGPLMRSRSTPSTPPIPAPSPRDGSCRSFERLRREDPVHVHARAAGPKASSAPSGR